MRAYICKCRFSLRRDLFITRMQQALFNMNSFRKTLYFLTIENEYLVKKKLTNQRKPDRQYLSL